MIYVCRHADAIRYAAADAFHCAISPRAITLRHDFSLDAFFHTTLLPPPLIPPPPPMPADYCHFRHYASAADALPCRCHFFHELRRR